MSALDETQAREMAALEAAAGALDEATVHLSHASTFLGRTDRNAWTYQCNALYRGARELADILENKLREPQ